MNKIMFDIMTLINDEGSYNTKKISQKLYKPYSIIEHEYNNLVLDGYVADGLITRKARKYLECHKIDNAIILSAGISSRFVPICFERPKALLPVKGEVLIERQIRQIQESGIQKIFVVVGYMKESFFYLKDKFGVEIVETDTYRTRNNHASLYAAKEYLNNSIVTSADLYFNENIFTKYAYDAFYCSVYVDGETDERGIKTDIYDRITETEYGVNNSWVTLGYAFFNSRFSENIKKIIGREYAEKATLSKFWADFQDENLKELYMYVKRIDNNVIYEFDSLDELRQFDADYLENSNSSLVQQISDKLECDERELHGFKPISKEDLGRGFVFLCHQHKYVCRIDSELNIEEIHRFDDSIQELVNLTESFSLYYDMSLPLCAAENIISPFVKLPLSMGFQERYIVGNSYSYSEDDNFIGSKYLLPFYQMISDKCGNIFHAKYTDARTLTGMNCLMMVLASLANKGERIIILDAASGGHASVRPIAERLGLLVYDAPYDYDAKDLDYEELNDTIHEMDISFILLAPSDIIKPFDVRQIDTSNTVLLYDISQMLGLIGVGLIENPLDYIYNCVIFGGTHKTFPGPASGLIMTNNERLHDILERTINPIYIRHTQMHQKVSLLFALVEFEAFGNAYEEHIVELSNALAQALSDRGFDVGRAGENWTRTHEVFIYTDAEVAERMYTNGMRFGITLNKKKKKLFNGYGIRLGTQEIARYGWPVSSADTIAQILLLTSMKHTDDNEIRRLIAELPPKKIQYTFDESVMSRFADLCS